MEVMAKQISIILVLLMVIWIDNNNIEAVRGMRESRAVYDVDSNVPKVRQARAATGFSGFFAGLIQLWNAFVDINYLYSSQKNETESALQQTHDILADGFTDTATRKIQLVELTTGEPNGTTTTTTERYRISRKELGYILGKNYRGLKKLFNIELNDALNQSKYSIQEYKEEHGNAVAQYTIKKEFPEPKQSKS